MGWYCLKCYAHDTTQKTAKTHKCKKEEKWEISLKTYKELIKNHI